jgi:hypothetical protein
MEQIICTRAVKRQEMTRGGGGASVLGVGTWSVSPWGGVCLAADVAVCLCRALLAAVTAPGPPHRPMFLPQALRLFRGALRDADAALAGLASGALLACEAALHPRSAPPPAPRLAQQQEPASAWLGAPRFWQAAGGNTSVLLQVRKCARLWQAARRLLLLVAGSRKPPSFFHLAMWCRAGKGLWWQQGSRRRPGSGRCGRRTPHGATWKGRRSLPRDADNARRGPKQRVGRSTPRSDRSAFVSCRPG